MAADNAPAFRFARVRLRGHEPPTAKRTAPGDAQEAAEAPTLLGALARAPAAAALVVAALKRANRKALRLVHSELRDAVDEATSWMKVDLQGAAAPRPPTARRWPRLEELRILGPDLAALEALGSATWRALRSLRLNGRTSIQPCTTDLDVPAARSLAAALRRMPVLCALELECMVLSEAVAGEMFRASSAEAAPQLRALTVSNAGLAPAAASALTATRWQLEELDLRFNSNVGAAGVAALVAAPTFALRRLNLGACGLDAAALLSLANTPWPLEELDVSSNDFSAAAAGRALAALSRQRGLRKLGVGKCHLSAAGFKALVEAAWPALTHLKAGGADVDFEGPLALGAAAFAGFPALEELDLSYVELREAGAALLASRRWPRLRKLNLASAVVGDAGLLALGSWELAALEELYLDGSGLGALSARFLVRGPWRSLRRLDLGGNNLGDAGLAGLARGAWLKGEGSYCQGQGGEEEGRERDFRCPVSLAKQGRKAWAAASRQIGFRLRAAPAPARQTH